MLGDMIKKRREQIGMSQDELAQKVGYKSRSSINKIELNKQDLWIFVFLSFFLVFEKTRYDDITKG